MVLVLLGSRHLPLKGLFGGHANTYTKENSLLVGATWDSANAMAAHSGIWQTPQTGARCMMQGARWLGWFITSAGKGKADAGLVHHTRKTTFPRAA